MALLSGGGLVLNSSRATDTRYGTTRYATDAEAAAGADIDTSITPDQLAAAVASGVGAVSGGLVYRGVFDASTGLPSLATGLKGDFYKVSVAGTYLGIVMNVGDNLILNANMGGVVAPEKIDLIDNTEAIIGIDDLNDVATDGVVAGQYLKYDGSGWVDSTIQISEVSGLQTDLTAKQNEINLIESSVGLTASGSLSPFTLTGIVAGKTTFKAAIDALSGELSSVDGERQATQTELDLTQTSVGLLASGSLSPFTLSGVAAGKTTIKAAIDALSADGVTLGNDILSVQNELDLTQESMGLLASGSLSPFTLTGIVAGKASFKDAVDALSVELLATRNDLQAELDLSQTSLGLLPSGSLSPFTLTGVVAGKTTFKAAIDALSASGVSLGNDIFATQTEMDLTQESLGLLASGSLSPFTGIFTSGKSTHKAAIEALDTRLNEKPDHVVYVSGEFGNNSYDGAAYTPKQTIAAALSSLPNDGSKAAIYLFPGTYSENITVSRTNTTIAGLSAAGRGGHITSISGSVSIEPSFSAGGIFNNFVIFENLLISQSGANPGVNLGGTFLYQAHFRNCQIFTDNVNVSLIKSNATVDSRLYFFNCSITHTGNSAFHTIELAKGQLFADMCEIYRNNGTSASRAIVLSGTASAPRITNTILTVTGCARAIEAAGVGNNLTMGNSVIGNSTANSTGIYIGSGAIATAVYTFFDVATAAGTGHIVDGAAGSVFVYGYNLYANDTTIGASVTKIPLAKDLATVATTGAYSDLTGKPNLAAVATSGQYADLLGSPTLADVATSGLYADLIGSPTLAAVATSGAASDVSVDGAPVNFTAASQTVEAFLDGIDNKIGTMDTAISDAGKVESVNGVSPISPSKDVIIDGSDIDAAHLAVNYVGSATLSIAGHLSAIDTALGNAGAVSTVNSIAPDGSKNVLLDAGDIAADLLAVNYVGSATLSIKGHLSGIDTALGSKADTVNGVSAIGGAITFDADSLVADRTGVNYIAASTLSVKAHLAAIDTALGNAGAVSTVNGVSPDGSKNVEIDGLDIDAGYAATNYVGGATLSIAGHLSAIDSVFPSKADTVNGVSAVDGAILFDADNLVADRDGVAYTATALQSVKQHLSAIDTALGLRGLVKTVNGTSPDINGAVVFDADSLVADRNGTNYTAAATLSVKAHLAAIDAALGGLGGGGGALAFSKNTASFTAVVNTHHSVDTTANAIAIAIPDLAGVAEGNRIRVRLTVRGGANNVTITSPSTLNGITSPLVLSVVGEHVEFFANKTDNVWEVLL